MRNFRNITLSPEILPTIVGFQNIYQQVRKEEGKVMVCLIRTRNLYREDTVNVSTVKQGKGKMLTIISIVYYLRREKIMSCVHRITT